MKAKLYQEVERDKNFRKKRKVQGPGLEMSTTNWLANGICQRLNSNKEDIYLPSPLQRLNPAAAAVDP